MTTVLIRAEDARIRTDAKRHSKANLLKRVRQEIAERIEHAIEHEQDSIRVSACWVQEWPEEIWKELKDLGYTIHRWDGNIDVKW